MCMNDYDYDYMILNALLVLYVIHTSKGGLLRLTVSLSSNGHIVFPFFRLHIW